MMYSSFFASLINLFFFPLIPVFFYYRKKNLPLTPSLELVFHYGMIAVVLIPITKAVAFLPGKIVGKHIDLDSGYYTLAALLSAWLLPSLVKWIKELHTKCIVNAHWRTRMLCLGLCFVQFIPMLSYNSTFQTDIMNVSVRSEDGAIDIRWNVPDFTLCHAVSIVILDGENVVYETKMWPMIQHLSYKDGEHGKMYTIYITAEYKNGRSKTTDKKQAMFLNYKELPNLPAIVINTANGEDPTGDTAEKPAGLLGKTLTNNDYVSGEMVMYENGIGGKQKQFTGMKMRIRGNSSAIENSKKPYKICLDEPYPLLGSDEQSCREWILLNSGHSLNTYVSDYVGDLCGIEWQPHMMFVNVILNGDWKGCYVLTTAVGIESGSSYVSDSGYIFENDAYFWNADGIYFQTEHISPIMGYTFKYPEIASPEDELILRLKNYMQEFGNYLMNGNERYKDYIDEASFAKWVLIHDIVGDSDPCGSNLYFYKYDYDENNPTSSKVKMGPPWDFDASFYQHDAWSRNRDMPYFPQLFTQDTYYSEYLSSWLSIAPHLSQSISELLNQLEEESGDALDASWKLDATRWNSEREPFAAQKENMNRWFERRVEWMNIELGVDSIAVPADDASIER